MRYEFTERVLGAIDRTAERIGGRILNKIGPKTWTDPQGKKYPILRGHVFDFNVPEGITLLEVGLLASILVPKVEIDALIESVRTTRKRNRTRV